MLTKPNKTVYIFNLQVPNKAPSEARLAECFLTLAYDCPHFQVPNEVPSEAWLANFYQNDFYLCRGGMGSRRKCGAGQWGSGDDSSEEDDERAEQNRCEEEAEMELQRSEDMCAAAECAAALKQLRAERTILLGLQAAANCGGSGGGSRGVGHGRGRGGEAAVHPDTGGEGASRPDCDDGDGKEGDADGRSKRQRRQSASDIGTDGGACAASLPSYTMPYIVLSEDSSTGTTGGTTGGTTHRTTDGTAGPIPFAAAQISHSAAQCALAAVPGGSSTAVQGTPTAVHAATPAAVHATSAAIHATSAAVHGDGGAEGRWPDDTSGIQSANGGEGSSISERLNDNYAAQITAIACCMEAVHFSRRPLMQKVSQAVTRAASGCPFT